MTDLPKDLGPSTGPPWPVHPAKVPSWKRGMDLLGAGSVALLTAPIWLFAIVMTRLTLGSPIFFKQWRGGHGGTRFEIQKFRTMTDSRGPDGEMLPDSDRTHWWGDFMRRSSIDELPGLLNIVRGDMSLVGPRPLYAVYLDRYSQRHAQRHKVKPGLTGLSQTQGRNALSWDERFELDLEYVEKQSLLLDIKILIDTVRTVVKGTGADGAKLTTVYAGELGDKTSGQE